MGYKMIFLKQLKIIAAAFFLFSLISCYEGLGGLVEEEPDPLAPSSPSLSVTRDTDCDRGEISLILRLTPPINNENIKAYRLYWGDSIDDDSLITEFDVNQSNFEITLPENTPVPDGVTTFSVYSISGDDVNSDPAEESFTDFELYAPALRFSNDSDRDEDQICGTLTLTEPELEDDVSFYRIYWGSADARMNLLCEFEKGIDPLAYNLPENTAVPSGVTHFVVQSVTADERVSASAAIDIEDSVLRKVAEITPGGAQLIETSEFYMAAYNGLLYFNATDGTGHGYELWAYDGESIPYEAADIYAGADKSSYPANFCVYNGKLFFKANGGDQAGTELWCFDGSAAHRVSDLYPGPYASHPRYMTVYNNKLYFSAEKSGTGRELYSYDGVSVSLAADIYPGSYSSGPGYFSVFKGKLYFQANYLTGTELWSYDGSTAVQVEDMGSSMFIGFNPSFMSVFNNELYFCADGDVTGHGRELWSYDGVNSQYEKFDLYPGFIDSTPGYMTIYNGRLYFRAFKSGAGSELWCYDGVNAPQMIANVDDTFYDSSPECFTVYKERLYFVAKDSSGYRRLWVFYIR